MTRPLPPLPELPELSDDDDLMTPAEVAGLFRVDVKTVGRWALRGRIPSTKTLGGHRRFRRGDVQAALENGRER